MVTKIKFDNINDELMEEKKPVLLACLLQDDGYKEQLQTLDSVSKNFAGIIKVCVVNQDSIPAVCRAYAIEGTPTFLFMYQGMEKDRLLGHVDSKTLSSFVRRTLPTLRRS